MPYSLYLAKGLPAPNLLKSVMFHIHIFGRNMRLCRCWAICCLAGLNLIDRYRMDEVKEERDEPYEDQKEWNCSSQFENMQKHEVVKMEETE